MYNCKFECNFSDVSAGQKEAREHAHRKVLSLRTWSYTGFYNALSTFRPEPERVSLMEHFYTLCEEEIAKDPAKCGGDYTHVYLHIVKIV